VALSFYKHLVLAPKYSLSLPVIDWSAENAMVMTQINAVQDESMRELLGKEVFARARVVSSLAQVKEQARRLEEKLARAREVARNIDSKLLDALTGDYVVEQPVGIILGVSRVKNSLYIQQSAETPVELFPLSEKNYFMVIGGDIYEIEFTMDATNQGNGMVITVYGQTFTARRK